MLYSYIYKNISLAFFLILIISFGYSGGERVFDGFSFNIPNQTDKVYKGVIVICGLIDNKFIPIDSLTFFNRTRKRKCCLSSLF